MPKFDKPDSPNIIWGVNALEGDLTRPDDSYIQTGWTQVKPPYEYENYSMNKLYQGFAYYNQLGFPEWDSVTEYQAGKSYVQGRNNRVYKCIQTHSNRNPTTAGNEAYWELFEGNRQATELSRGTSRIATEQQVINTNTDSEFVTPLKLKSGFSYSFDTENGYIKLPNWLSGLTIQWGRITNVEQSKKIFNLPVEFQNTGLQIVGTHDNPDASYSAVTSLNFESKSQIGAIMRPVGATISSLAIRFIAIGY